MAEVHLVGQLIGASKFGKSNLFCVWDMQAGQQWIHISGDKKGQTQIDAPAYDEICIWSHPIDLHYSTSTPVGWPKLIFQVWYQDSYGRNDFCLFGADFFCTRLTLVQWVMVYYLCLHKVEHLIYNVIVGDL